MTQAPKINFWMHHSLFCLLWEKQSHTLLDPAPALHRAAQELSLLHHMFASSGSSSGWCANLVDRVALFSNTGLGFSIIE